MSKRIHTLLWYLQRPGFYPQLLNEIITKMHTRFFAKARSIKEAKEWCQANAVSNDDVMKQLGGIIPIQSLEKIFPVIFGEAQEKARECPVKMGGPGNLDLLFALAECAQAVKVLETGVAYGWSSLALLLSLRNRPGSRLISTDMPYPGLHNELYVGCVVPESIKSHWTLIPYPDRTAIPKALKDLGNNFDMCHYDSDKSWLGRMWAYKRLWKSLRQDGFFVTDDIGDNLAFKCFAESVGVKPMVVEWANKYVGILVKRTNA